MAFSTPPEVLLRQCLRAGRTAACLTLSPCGAGVPARTYRAAVVTQLGQPMVIQKMPPLPALKSKEVLISTHAVGVNFADLLMTKGQYQVKMKVPFVPGYEVSGKVVEVGPDVKSCKVGDRVFALSQGCDGFAELCIANSQRVYPVPDNLPLVEAAGTFTCYGTAMMALTRKANIQHGEKVLVTAAAGATGMAAVDIAKNLFGCQVVGTCGSSDKGRFLLERGVDHVIDYSKEKIRDRVKEITRGQGVDLVVDQVGGDTLIDCIKSLAFEGRALTVGYVSGQIPKVPANLLLLKSSSLIGVYWGSYVDVHPAAFVESIEKVQQAVREGKIKPYVCQTFPLDQINEAFQFITDKKNVGKVVIKFREEDTPPGM